jgi:hypothetical protein
MTARAMDDAGIDDLKKSLYDDSAQILVVLVGSRITKFNILATATAKLLLDERNMQGLFFCFDKPSSMYSKMFETKITNIKKLTFIDAITNISSTKVVTEGTIMLESPFQDAIFNEGFRILGEVFGGVPDGQDGTGFQPVSDAPSPGAPSSGAQRYDFILIDNLNSASYYLSDKKVENFVVGLIDLIKNLTNTKMIILANTDNNPALYQKIKEISNREVVLK